MTANEIGQQLGVRYLLEGSLQDVGESVSVNVQLIETAGGFHRWAQEFRAQDGPNVVADLLAAIAGRVEMRLTRAIYDDLRAHEGRLNARELLVRVSSHLAIQGWHRDTFEEAAVWLREAIALDPDRALSHAYLALVLALGHRVGLLDRSGSVIDEVVAHAGRALALDRLDSNVLSRAGCALADIGQIDRAVPLLENALELNPQNGHAWTALGSARALAGAPAEAIEPLERGIAISPMDSRLGVWRTALSLAYLDVGDLERALVAAQEGCRSDDRLYLPWVVLTSVRLERGEEELASRALDEALRVKPDLSADEVAHLIGDARAQNFEALRGRRP